MFRGGIYVNMHVMRTIEWVRMVSSETSAWQSQATVFGRGSAQCYKKTARIDSEASLFARLVLFKASHMNMVGICFKSTEK